MRKYGPFVKQGQAAGGGMSRRKRPLPEITSADDFDPRTREKKLSIMRWVRAFKVATLSQLAALAAESEIFGTEKTDPNSDVRNQLRNLVNRGLLEHPSGKIGDGIFKLTGHGRRILDRA